MGPAKENNIYAPNVLTCFSRCVIYIPIYYIQAFTKHLLANPCSFANFLSFLLLTLTLVIMNVLNSGKYIESPGMEPKSSMCSRTCGGDKLRSPNIMFVDFFSESCQTKFLYISHLTSLRRDLPLSHAQYDTSYYIYVYTLSLQ